MSIWYCTREDVKSALDIKETARANAQVDRAIASSSRTIENLCNRVFYPTIATRYFDWPAEFSQTTAPWRLWLDEYEVISVISLSSGGVTIPATDYFLEPNAGPPYDRIELDLADSSSFGQGATFQHDIALKAVYGYDNVIQAKGTLVGSIASGTSITVSDGSVGVGALLTVDSEKMVVTEKSWLATSDTINNALTASMADDTVQSDDGTAYATNEVIAIDSEKMLIVDILGNNLVVKRAWDGSTLASHSSATAIYAKRVLTVSRGQLGTEVIGHLDGTTIYQQVFADGINALCVALSLNTVLQEQSGYSRTVGTGDNQRNASGDGLDKAKSDVYQTYGRQARMKTV